MIDPEIEHMRALNYLVPSATTGAALGAMEEQERLKAIVPPGLVRGNAMRVPRTSSSGLRKIADEAQRIIDERMEYGVSE